MHFIFYAHSTHRMKNRYSIIYKDIIYPVVFFDGNEPELIIFGIKKEDKGPLSENVLYKFESTTVMYYDGCWS